MTITQPGGGCISIRLNCGLEIEIHGDEEYLALNSREKSECFNFFVGKDGYLRCDEFPLHQILNNVRKSETPT